MTTHDYRRMERGIVAQLGWPDETRRDLMERETGHRSSTELDERGWRRYVNALRREVGQPPLSGGPSAQAEAAPRPGDLPAVLDVGATRDQIATIESLAVEWMDFPEGLPQFIRDHVFGKRRAVEAAQWSGSLATLPRDIASRTVKQLLKVKAAAQRRAAARGAGILPAVPSAPSEVPF